VTQVAEKSTGLVPFTTEHFLNWVEVNELSLEDGEPWIVEPFQVGVLEDLLRRSVGLKPLYREGWGVIPEGNAKTTLFGGAALYLGDHCPSPWIPIGAASRDQAEIMFGQAAGFVQRSDRMQERFHVYEGYRKIKCHTGGRGIKVYAADAGTGDGVIPFPIALIDEPHRHKDMSLYRLWRGKLGKRGAAIWLISTAGEPGSEFELMREKIRQQTETRTKEGCHLRAEGKNLVYHEWMVPKIEQADDLEVVKQANPLAHITPDYLKEKRESLTLDYGTDWLRFTCNIPTRPSFAAIPESDWDACETEERIPEGVEVMVGADFAFLEDTTAIQPLWVKASDFRLLGDPYILQPPQDGTMLDVDDIKQAFLELKSRNPISMVVMDRARAEDIAQWLSSELGVQVVTRPQTNEWAAKDYESMMKGIRERTLYHTGHAGLRQHVLDAISARVLGDKRRFDRPRTIRKAGQDRRRIVIDALTAAGMVVSMVDENPESVYKDRGVTVIAA
jgi:phage terminase large subunit-like protein